MDTVQLELRLLVGILVHLVLHQIPHLLPHHHPYPCLHRHLRRRQGIVLVVKISLHALRCFLYLQFLLLLLTFLLCHVWILISVLKKHCQPFSSFSILVFWDLDFLLVDLDFLRDFLL